MRKTDLSKYLLIGIFLIAAFLRLLGTHPGFSLTHADEQSTFGHIYNIVIKHTLQPGDFYYGPLLGYIYSIVDIVFFIPMLFTSFATQNLYSYVAIQQKPFMEFFNFFTDTQLKVSWPYFDFGHNYLTYWGRYSTAVLSSLTVVVIYFLGTSLFKKKGVGLIAAFLTAVNYRHVTSSTLLLADSPAALFAALSLLLSFSVLKNKTMRAYLLVGVGLALAYLVKYFIYVLPAFLVCHALSVWQISKAPYLKKVQKIVFNKKFIFALAFSVVLFLMLHPYLIIKSEVALKQFKNNATNYQIYSSSLDLSVDNYSLYPLYYLWKYALGITLSIVTLGGVLYALIRYTKESIILLSAIIPFFYVFLGMAGRVGTVHNFSSIIPILLLFPALLIYRFGQLIPLPRKLFPLIIVTLSLLIGSSSLKNSLVSSYYYSKLPNSYVYASWQEANIPKGSSATLIDPVRERYMTMQDLREEKFEWAVVDSNWNIIINDKWTKNNDLIKKTFFNEDLFWKALDNTYLSLITKELGDYRVKEIVKPFWQPLDFAFFIIRVPEFWNIYDDELIDSYNFTKNADLEKWNITSFLLPKPDIRLDLNKDDNKTFGARITAGECALQTQISTGKISVLENKWHSISGLVKRKNKVAENDKDGFLRLNFYSSDNKIVKTYVSQQVGSVNWEKISASGIAPFGSKYATVSFQVDKCFTNEEYYLNQIKIFTSDADTKIDRSKYPYYGKSLPKNFIWAPIKYL